MPKFAIVVVDAKKHVEFERTAYASALHRQRGMSPKAARQHAETNITAKPKGFKHVAELDSECPDGHPNCRHCGDPAYADRCRAAGHCQRCGIDHGVAPESVLAAHGLALKAVK